MIRLILAPVANMPPYLGEFDDRRVKIRPKRDRPFQGGGGFVELELLLQPGCQIAERAA